MTNLDAAPERRTVVCLPTYNEHENIAPLIAAVSRRLPAARLLVIDDQSPDGTGDVVAGIAQRDPRVHLLRRGGKEGLGRAYVAGFRHALEVLQAERIIQMDADFSHPVAVLPPLLAQAEYDDLVVGSRYVPGGGIERWGRGRRLISRFGSAYARRILGAPFHDLTSGFKIWRAELLRSVLRYPIGASGYVFQIEMTYLAWRLGARIHEMPFCFVERGSGQSKMSLAIALEAAWRVPMMRLTHADVQPLHRDDEAD